MKKVDWDNLPISADEENNRYVAKVTIIKGEPRKNVYGNTREEVERKVKKLIYKSGNVEYMVL